MSFLNIKIYGDGVLRDKAKPVKVFNKKILDLIDNMTKTMYKARGVGLAANQVGVLKRIIVIDVTVGESGRKNLIVFVNPKIVEKEGLLEEEEGCLSVPGINGRVKRFAKVTVCGLNDKGKPVKITASDLLSRVLQHEIDHLDGILFVDHLSFTQKIFIQNQLKELKERKKT